MQRIVSGFLASGLVLSPTIGLAQKLGGASGDAEPSLIRIVGALIICAIAGSALIIFVRRRMGLAPSPSPVAANGFLSGFMKGRQRRRLRVIESTLVAPNAAIVLLQCDDDEFLVGAGAQGFLVLSRRKIASSEAEL